MSNQLTGLQEDSEEFQPKSFIIFCLDEDGNIALELSWGEKEEEIKRFAMLLNKINKGEFDKMIVDQLKQQSKTQTNGSKNFTVFNKAYKELNKPKDLVVDPTNVELH